MLASHHGDGGRDVTIADEISTMAASYYSDGYLCIDSLSFSLKRGVDDDCGLAVTRSTSNVMHRRP